MRTLARAALIAGLISFGACAPAADARGTISGTLAFPSEEVPPLRVYAIAQDGKSHYSVTTAAKQTTFSITGVPPGQYLIVAYPTTADAAEAGAGGWSRFVQCGATVACKDHSLVPVVVTAGQTASGINVADWYAERGTFPREPVE